MGDDLIVNQGGDDFWAQPEERQEEESHQNGVLQASYPILAEIYDWFEQQVAMCDHITNIDLESKVDPVIQMKAYQMLHNLLEQKMVEFAQFKDER